MRYLYFLSILNSCLLALPIFYFLTKNNLKTAINQACVILIVLYGILECFYGLISKIHLLYLADTCLLVGSLIIFPVSLKNRTNNFISNPVISAIIIFVFLLGTSIINNILHTTFLITSLIYYYGIMTIAHIYQNIIKKGSHIAVSMLTASLIICFIYDTLYYSGRITLQQYNLAPWYIQYILQSTSGLLCLYNLKKQNA